MRRRHRPHEVCLRVSLLLTLAAVRAAAASASSVELTVKSGDIDLAATILLPESTGIHPAVVLLSGSGPSTRAKLRPMADQIVARGWAVLIYDKRGCGDSKGDWTATSLSELADDAVSAITALAGRPEIDPSRIGLWGNSNSGWVGPIAANRTDAARFLVVFTGGGARPRDVELFGYDQRLAHAQLTDLQVAEARKAVDAYLRYLETGRGLDDLKATLAAPANRPWAEALGLERVLPSENGRKAWEWVSTYDPVPDIARLKIPTLVLLGGNDEDSPLTKSVAGWSSGLAMTGNPRSQILVVPAGSHSMNVGEHHHPGAGAPQFVPGVFDEVVEWERANGARPPQP
jgi:pimeloyl-ACP methyl ester carboxylesterase